MGHSRREQYAILDDEQIFAGALADRAIDGQANAFGVLAAPALAVVLPFAVMTLVLMTRPWGLFGKPE